MDIAALLMQLPADRLRQLVHRRAATLRLLPRVADKQHLANALAESLFYRDSIAAAIRLTALSEARILVWLAAHGGDAEIEPLLESAGEENRERCLRAVDGLEQLGLAFWTDPQLRQTVHVPAAVCREAPVPLPLRHTLKTALNNYDKATVGKIMRTLGLSLPDPSKAGAIRAIRAELNTPEGVQGALQSASEEARRVFHAIAKAAGGIRVHDVASIIEPRKRSQVVSIGWSLQWTAGVARNGVEELLLRGLTVVDSSGGWGSSLLVIPGDVLAAAENRPPTALMIPPEPVWETLPAANLRSAGFSALLRDLAYLVGYVGRTETAQTAAGIIHRNALKALARGLTDSSLEYAGFVYALAMELELISARDPRRYYEVTAQAYEWMELGQAEQRASLFEAWFNGSLYLETAEEPLLDERRYVDMAGTTGRRQAALEILRTLDREAPGEAASIHSLAEYARFNYWGRFPYAEEVRGAPPDHSFDYRGEPATVAEALRRIVGMPLYWLGIVETAADESQLTAWARLTAAGRALLEGGPFEQSEGSGRNAFRVLPNLEIVVPPDLSVGLLYRVFQLGEVSGAGVVSLSRESLRRAFDHGETAESTLDFLRAHSETPVPQNVEYLVQEVGGRHGHIRVGQAGLFLQVSDPLLLREIEAQKGLKITFRDKLADTVALITGDSVQAVLKQLRQAGYFPVEAGRKAGRRAAGAAGTGRKGGRKPRAAGTASRANFALEEGLRHLADNVDSTIDWKRMEADERKET